VVFSLALVFLNGLQPGSESVVSLFLGFGLFGFGYAATLVMAVTLLSEIADYSSWKFKVDCAGTLFSFYYLILKINFAVGGAIALSLAGWYGFDPAASSHLADAVSGVRLSTFWLPALLSLLSIFLIISIPITARKHAIIRRRLDTQDRRLERYQPSLNHQPLNEQSGPLMPVA
jgi:Na+/melibiose symporter-like transporter